MRQHLFDRLIMKFSRGWPFLLISIVGCSGILTQRSFMKEMDHKNERFFRPGRDFPVVIGDTMTPYHDREEILKRIPLPKRHKHKALREELLSKEAQLSEQELIHYKEANEYLANDSERIFYLSLSANERASYMQHKGVKYKTQNKQERTVSSVEMELHLGMSQDDVMGHYGRPNSIEIVGSHQREQEKWIFHHNGTIKYVYFEEGFVQGWSSK